MLTIKKLKNSLQSLVPASWWGETWREGFFSGNGRIGINAFGGALNEKILINSSDLNWQGKISVLPDVSSRLKEIRRHIEQEDTEQAQSVWQKAFSQKNFHPQPFCSLPLAVLNLKIHTDKTPKDYSRLLNTSNGEISVTYVDGTTKMTRNMFVSRDDEGLIVCELVKSGQKLIDVDISFALPDKLNACTPTGASAIPSGVYTKVENGFLFFSAKNDDATEFGAVAKITYYGGTVSTKEDNLKIRGANSVLIVIKTFANSYKEKEFSAIKATLTANKLTYDKLLKSHQSIHQKEMDNVEIEIEPTRANDTIENLLLETRRNGVISPVLAKKMWNYGRYLLYSSTCENGKMVLPAGLFNGNYKPQKNFVDFSGKIQSSYQSVFVGGMENLLEPLFLYLEQSIGDMRDNAIRLFGVRGLFLPAITTGATGRVGCIDPAYLHFTGCAGYVAGLFFDYYLFTHDQKFLKTRAMPFMKEVAQFYEQFFQLTKEDIYETTPSYCPLSIKKGDNNPIRMYKNATVDFAIAKQLLTNLIEGATITGLYKEEIEKWQNMLVKIPQYPTDAEGNLQDYRGKDVDLTTASTASLYSAYASREVDQLCDEETQKAFIATARKKMAESGGEQTAMTLINLARVFIRLKQKNQAIECLTNVINNCAYNNLALSYCDWRSNGVVGEDSWSPMQLCANMAFATAIQEMLLYSKTGVISVLPCLPNDWKNVRVENARAVGNLSVTIELSAKGVLNLIIKAKKNAIFDLYLPENVKKLKKSNLPLQLQTENGVYVKDVTIPAGKSATFTFTYSF